MRTNRVILNDKKVLVTGSSGFIGSNLVIELLRTQPSIHIIGIDNMNDYYDVLKILFQSAVIAILL